MSAPVIVVGGGGHARVVTDCLRLRNIEVLGVVDHALEPDKVVFDRIVCLGGDDVIGRYAPDDIRLANGIGSVGDTTRRRDLFERFRARGYRFVTTVHPSAVVAASTDLAEGAQVMAGSVIQAGSNIGMNTIINTGALVDHDCRIGDHAHVAPGAVLSGGVVLDAGVHVGTGARIIQGIRVGAEAVVGAGVTVLDDVDAGVTLRASQNPVWWKVSS